MSDAISLPSDADKTGRDFGEEELTLLREVIESGTLNCTKGTQVNAFERDFAARYGMPHARAVTSGTAAIHTAISAIDPEPGDEIITTAITDMGGLSPILYQGAIPIFADVDPVTLNVTADAVASRITSRTRAIIATHLFGNPCDMQGIMRIATAHGIPVIEDCAQAFLATDHGRLVGTIGAIGAFSLQQGKHMTTGEGGVVVTADPQLARWMTLFSDKAWGYGDPKPDHYFLPLSLHDPSFLLLSWLNFSQALLSAGTYHTTLPGREKIAIDTEIENHYHWAIMHKTLADLRPSEEGRIRAVTGVDGLSQRLCEMGFTAGQPVLTTFDSSNAR